MQLHWNINRALASSNLSRYHLISQSHCHKLNFVDTRPRYAITKPVVREPWSTLTLTGQNHPVHTR